MHSKYKLLALAISVATISACSNSKNEQINQPPIEDIAVEYQGVWVSSAYADVLNVKNDSVEYYKYTSDYCILQDSFDGLSTSDLARSVELSENNDALRWIAGYGTQEFGAPSRELVKQNSMPASCQNNVFSSESTLDNTEWFNLYSQIMQEYYVDFSRMNVDWQQLSYDLSLNITPNINTLYEAIFQSFISLQDGHNSFEDAQGTLIKVLAKPTHFMNLIEEYANENGLAFPLDASALSASQIDAIENYIDDALEIEQDIILSYANTSIKQDPSEQISWFAIDDIGYLRIDAMTGYSTQSDDSDDLAQTTSSLNNLNSAIDKVLTDFSETTGLIIDIRSNGGGNDYISLTIASRFTNAEFVAYKKYARDGNSTTEPQLAIVEPSLDIQYTEKPIVLLVSEETASAAEVFALTMSQLSTVTLVGQATQGIFSDVLEFALPNGRQLGISNEVYLTPSDVWLEGTGVPVNVEVEYFSKNDRDSGIDSGIENALAILQ